jgi:hypothetical protein
MKFGFLAALAVALVPAAQAQSGCALMDKLVASAGSNFADIRGEEIDDGWYDVNTTMTGAEECSVTLGDKSVYDCIWSYPAEAEAKTKARALEFASVQCLPGWTSSDMTGKKSFNNLPIGFGTAFASGGKSVEIHVEVLDATQTSVWFRVLGP